MKSTETLRNTIIVMLFGTLAVPLIFSGNLFFPYITGKGFAFRIAIEIMVALYVILMIRDRSYAPKKSVILWTVLGFLAVMGLATINSEYPYKSFWSNYERMEGYITLLHLGVYFIVMSAVFNTKKIWTWFLNASLIMSLIVGARGFMDLGAGITRISGSLGNSTYLGVYALIHIFIAGFFLVDTLEKNKDSDTTFWRRVVLYSLVAIYNTVVMYYTATRGSFVGLLAGGIAVALILAIFEKQKKYLRIVGMFGLALTIGTILLLGAIKNTDYAKTHSIGRFSSLITLDIGKVLQDQGYGRVLLWKVAWQGVKERPLLGWGQENFNYVFAKYYDPQLYSQEQWFDRAHNVFMDWLIAGGVLGLLSYLALFAGFIWYLIRLADTSLSKGEKAVLAGLVVAYSVHNLFVFDHLVSYLLFFALLAYMHRLVLLEGASKVHKKDHKEYKGDTSPLIQNESVQYLVGGVVCIVAVSIMYVVSIRPLEANFALIGAFFHQAEYTDRNSARAGDPVALEDAYKSYQEALSYGTFGTPEIREQLSSSAQGVLEQSATTSGPALQLAIKEMRAQTVQTPHDPRYFYFLAGILSHTGNYEQALTPAKIAEKLSPTKQSFKFLDAEILINEKKYDDAFAVAKQGYDLAPLYDQAQLFYVTAAIYAHKDDIVASLLKQYPAIASQPQIYQSYVVSKQFDKAIPILEGIIKDNANTDAEAYVYLAAAYLETGQRNKSRSTLVQAKTLTNNPQTLAEIDYFIGLIDKGENSLIKQ